MMRAIAIFVTAIFVATTGAAHAYIDPGTGSVVTTAILGFFAAIGFTLRKYFYRVKDLVTGKKTESEKETTESDS